MAQDYSSETTSVAARRERTVPALLIAMIALFVLIVGYGWLRLLEPILGSVIGAGALALLLTVIALLAARLIGEARAASLAQESDGESRMLGWLLLYPFLFAISALGTINFAFYEFEGASVLRGKIDLLESRLAEVQERGGELLAQQPGAQKRARVNQALASLKEEINNPHGGSYCGVGSRARDILASIQRDLPIRILAGGNGMRQCDRAAAERIFDSYRTQAQSGLDNDPAVQRITALEARLDRARAASTRLQQADAALAPSGYGTTEGSGYAQAQEAILAAALTDNRARNEFASLPGGPETLPAKPEVDVRSALELGSIFTLIPSLIERWAHLTTYVYLVVAILLDLALVFLFARVASMVVTRTRTRVSTFAPRSDPQFLWVNFD